MLQPNKCFLVIIDVQGKLAGLMHEKESLFKNIKILTKAANILEIPIINCRQCPDVLGDTIDEIKILLGDIEPVDKSSFSCCGEYAFNSRLATLNRPQAILCGIESHICVYQTASDLLDMGLHVEVATDATSSRTKTNKLIALEKMKTAGEAISSTEMILFELLKTAQHPQFREIAKLVK